MPHGRRVVIPDDQDFRTNYEECNMASFLAVRNDGLSAIDFLAWPSGMTALLQTSFVYLRFPPTVGGERLGGVFKTKSSPQGGASITYSYYRVNQSP